MATASPTSGSSSTSATEVSVREIAATGTLTTVKIPVINDDGKKPDLTIVQLIALAILSKESRSATAEEIAKWIFDNFRFYGEELFKKAMEDWYDDVSCHRAGTVNICDEVKLELNDQIARYEPVLQRLSKGQALRRSHGRRRGHHILYEGQVFYNGTFGIVPGTEGIIFAAFNINPVAFPFMQLPAELRVQIYRYVLEYPSATGEGLAVLSRVRMAIHRSDSKHIDNQKLLPPMGSILALLSVSKQVNREALSVFYRHNHFHFNDCLRTFWAFMERMGPLRRKHLAHITVEHVIDSKRRGRGFTPNGGMYMALRYLAQSEHLKTFHLTVNALGRTKEDDMEIPGLHLLGSLRGLQEVVITSNVASTIGLELLKDVKEKMLLPKPEETSKRSKTAAATKRKAKAVGEDGSAELPTKRSRCDSTAAPLQTISAGELFLRDVFRDA